MTWAGFGPSGLFWTINTDGSIGRVDWEEARGDVSGVIDNLVVIALQGSPVSPETPLIGNVLQWDGSSWSPTVSSGVGAHDLLSLVHPDTIPDSPIAGDIITGSGAPASWIRFPIGQSGQRLTTSNSLTLEWAEPNVIEPLIVTSGTVVNLDSSSRKILIIKTVGSDTDVNLPASPIFGQEIMIKDGKGDSGPPLNNEIDIIPQSGVTIDSLSKIIIGQNYGAFTILWNGTEWNIV